MLKIEIKNIDDQSAHLLSQLDPKQIQLDTVGNGTCEMITLYGAQYNAEGKSAEEKSYALLVQTDDGWQLEDTSGLVHHAYANGQFPFVGPIDLYKLLQYVLPYIR
jgi:hypothetical protein